MSTARPFTVVAIIAAHNEADVIEHVVRDLIEQGVSVYFIDDDSTDGTREIVERYVGRGVLAVERLNGTTGVFELARILTRKTQLAQTLDADWFINHDADEFRESPWPGMPLREAVAAVGELGYNAIDFALLDFWPVDDGFRPGEDVRQHLRYFAYSQAYNRKQIRCWKRTSPVDLIASGGHEAAFEGRDVFPLQFLLRHYPIRSEAHGRRKIFAERRDRFAPEELQRGWHIQYREYAEGGSVLRPREALTLYDACLVRRALLPEAPAREWRLERARLEQALTVAQRALELLNDELDTTRQGLSSEAARLRQRITELEQSLSWRITAPFRGAMRWVTGREF
jgi:hypothetical protein